MKTKPEFLSNFVYSLTTILALSGITYFAFLQAIQKPCCDATVYLNYGMSLLNNSLLVPPSELQPSDLRTFFYPVFLATVIRIAKFLLIEPLILVTIVQTLIYVLAVNFVTKRVHSTRTNTQRNIWVALMMNFFIWPYLSTTLTDSLYVSLFLYFLGICINVFRPPTKESQSSYSNTFYLTLCFSTLLVLRPASIWIAPIFLSVVFSQIKKKERSRVSEMLHLLFGLAPILYQIYINLFLFAKFTPFPVVDLGRMQVNWGIRYLKYITWLGGGNPQGIYPSKNLIGSVPENLTVGWYLQNPFLGTKLLLVKLVGAFDFDFLVPYPQNHPWYSFFIGAFSLSILLIGCLILINYLFGRKTKISQNLFPRSFPLAIFLCWTLVTSVSAVELRFTLPILTFFVFLIASEGVPVPKNQRRQVVYGISILAILILMLRVAFFVRSQATF